MSHTLLLPENLKVPLAYELRRSARELRDRGLLVAAKWSAPAHPFTLIINSHYHRASELLSALPEYVRSELIYELPHHTGAQKEAGPSRIRTRHGVVVEEEEDVLEEDTFQLARSYFEMKEFDRVVFTLQHSKGKKAKFLKVYSGYLVSRGRCGGI
jgi:anaphase-promoting complex subunit 8